MKKYYWGFVAAMLAISLWGVMSRFQSTHSTSQNQQLILGTWQNINNQETLTFNKTKVTITTNMKTTMAYQLSGNKLTFRSHKYTINLLNEKRLLITYRNGTKMYSEDYQKA